MVEIVNAKTKKALKESINNGEPVFIENPSIFNPRSYCAEDIKEGEKSVVTNHPKRSFFATIERKNNILKVY